MERTIQERLADANKKVKEVIRYQEKVAEIASEPTSKENFQEVSTIMLRIVECWPIELSQKFHRMYEKQRYHM